MYSILNNIFFFVVIVGFAYFFIQLKNQWLKIKEIESQIDDYVEFENKVTSLGVTPSDLTEYFRLRDKHKLENIAMIVMEKEEEDKIDKDALVERQKQEIEELMARKRPSSDIFFPAKK